MTIDEQDIPFTTQSDVFILHIGYYDTTTRRYESQSSNTTTVNFINGRSYNIEYSCMGSSYDLRTRGYQFGSTLINSYRAANTEINTTTHDPNLPVGEVLDISNEGIIQWGDQYASGGSSHNPNVVVLFGVKDYFGSGCILGVAARSGQGGRSYGLVFLQRIDSCYSGFYESEKSVMRTRVAIHELGHCRRKNQSWQEWNEEPPLGNPLHQGRNKSICIMGGGDFFDPFEAFHFCERHKQVLLNINW